MMAYQMMTRRQAADSNIYWWLNTNSFVPRKTKRPKQDAARDSLDCAAYGLYVSYQNYRATKYCDELLIFKVQISFNHQWWLIKWWL